jgi:hypothetical protein
MKRRLKGLQKFGQRDQGFTLVVAMAIGVIMLLLTTTLITKAQQDQAISTTRSRTSNSLAVAEGGMARTLAELIKAHNSVLLTRSYDPLNLQTNKTYFGPDGILNNGDEEAAAVNEWSNIPASCGAAATPPSITYTGAIGANGQYTLKAYRYNASNKTGTFLVEGKEKTGTSYLVVTTAISSSVVFPGVVSMEQTELSGRRILGGNGNIYYDPALSSNPSLTGSAAPGAANRDAYLNAIRSGSAFGFSDNVAGTVTACKLALKLSISPQGTDLGTLKDTQTLPSSGSITYYQAKKVELKGTSTVSFDTTTGKVYFYVDDFKMEGNSKIRNVRTDGRPPQVGDLRIIGTGGKNFDLKDNACIETAFFYNPSGHLDLGTSGDGCPSSGETNVDGVVWVQYLHNNSASPAGIAVPEDVSSLSDILNDLNLPIRSKLNGVLNWQRVKL